ncbi:lipid-A-disaccharide synthase [Gemmatimonas sp.]|uniref:lipid-A-disaccharide synthase n=1 Tax=Gemmatimonas sp. TaxID=1962908 RepID=UPI0037BF453B
MREVLFVVGEASGDLHAGKVAEVLRQVAPAVPLVGVGGGHMRRAGVEIIEDVEQLAVMGFVEVLQHIPRHWALLRRLRARMASGRVGLVVLLDYPGFNLKVAEAARAAGIPVLYYITPQVWAWGANRLPKIARLVTKAASILPFEEALLRQHGVDATFVGHPLLDRAQDLPSTMEARAELGLDVHRPVLALFPGSRRAEIARHLDLFVATAQAVQRRRPEVQVVVGVAPTVSINAADCPFPLVQGASFVVQRAATAGLLKSGTNTLEAAVAGLPHVIGYRTSGITYAIAKRVVTIPHIGLVNVVAGREVSPEFVQERFVPERVAAALLPLLEAESPARSAALAGLAEVRARLGTPGASRRVAEMIAQLLAA